MTEGPRGRGYKPELFETGTPTGPTPTPEPSSLALLGTGIVVVAGLVRRKLKKTLD
jgi:hypothetical protein